METDTASDELFFNIVISGIEIFVIPWDQLMYPVSKKSAAWDYNLLKYLISGYVI